MSISIYDDFLDLQMYLNVEKTFGIKGKYLFDFNERQEANYCKVDDFLYLVEHPEELSLKELRTVGLLIVGTELCTESFLAKILDTLVQQKDVFLEVVAFYGFEQFRTTFAESLLITERDSVAEYVFALTPMLEYQEYHLMVYNMLQCIAAWFKKERPGFAENPSIYGFLAQFGDTPGANDFARALRRVLYSIPKANSVANSQLALFHFGTVEIFFLHYCVLEAEKSYQKGSHRRISFANEVVHYLANTALLWSEQAKELFSYAVELTDKPLETIIKRENWEWVREQFGSTYPRLLVSEATTSFYKSRLQTLSEKELRGVLPQIVSLNEEFLSFALTPSLKNLFSKWDENLEECYSVCKKYLDLEQVAVRYKCEEHADMSSKEDFCFLESVLESFGWGSPEVEVLVQRWKCDHDLAQQVGINEFFEVYEEYLFYYCAKQYPDLIKKCMKILGVKKTEAVSTHLRFLKKFVECDSRVFRLFKKEELTLENETLSVYGEFYHVTRAIVNGASVPVDLDSDCLSCLDDVLYFVDSTDWELVFGCFRKVWEVTKSSSVHCDFFRTVEKFGWQYFDEIYQYAISNERLSGVFFYLNDDEAYRLREGILNKESTQIPACDETETKRVQCLCEDAGVRFSECLVGKFPWKGDSIKHTDIILKQHSKEDLKTAVVVFSHECYVGIQFCKNTGLSSVEVLRNWELFLNWYDSGLLQDALRYELSGEKEHEIFWKYLRAVFKGELISVLSGMRKISLLVGTEVSDSILEKWFDILKEQKLILCNLADIDLNKIVTKEFYAVLCCCEGAPVILVDGTLEMVMPLKEIGIPVFRIDEKGSQKEFIVNTGLFGVNVFPWSESPVFYDDTYVLKCSEL